METIEQRFTVPYRYLVHLTEDAFAPENDLLARTLGADSSRRPRALVAIDRGVLAARPDLAARIDAYAQAHGLDLADSPLVLPGGEAAKNDPRHLACVLAAIERGRICRHSYVVAIGGGAMLDVVGFAAAQAHRGVRLVRLPTTVLAQCDAAVGVKNGINAFGKKNFLGSFTPPWAVINDLRFLDTLSARDWRAGIAEAVKVALIRDAAFFARLERNADRLVRRDHASMRELIAHAARLHLEHIARGGDPFETGSARPLDFGHWAAHKLEQLSRHRLRHGEAVAIGMALDATYSHLAGWFAADALARVLALLEGVGFELDATELGAEALLAGLDEFREHLGGALTVTLLRGIGQGFEVHAMDEARIRASVAHLRARSHRSDQPAARSLAGGTER